MKTICVTAVACVMVGLVMFPPTATAQGPYATITSAGFDIKYQRGVREEQVRGLLEFMVNDRKLITTELGFGDDRRIEVRVYESVGKYLAETGLKQSWRGAFYTKGVLHTQPIDALVQRDILEPTISYELAMAMLDGAAEKGCPRWLREAYAVYHSGEMATLTPAVGVKVASFSDLEQDIQAYPNPPQRSDVHYVLGLTMEFFFERYTREKALTLYREFNGMRSVQTVLKAVLAEEYAAIEKAWAERVRATTSAFPKR